MINSPAVVNPDSGTGADGTLDLSLGSGAGGCNGTGLSWNGGTSTCTVALDTKSTFNFSTINIPVGTILNVSGGPAVLALKATSTVTIAGSINLNALGYGTTAGPGAGGDGSSDLFVGGGGYYDTYYYGGGGGGYGGVGGNGGGVGGSVYSTVSPGSGGGLSGYGTSGGAGGGAVLINGGENVIISGSITVNGGGGSNYGGGGGSGGYVGIYTNYSITNTGTISANGGSGGSSYSTGNIRYCFTGCYYLDTHYYSGGSGGGGRIILQGTRVTAGTLSVTGANSGVKTANVIPNSPYGILLGSTKPTWQASGDCVSGKCLSFNGSSASVSASVRVGVGIKTVSFWVKPATTTQSIVDFDGGTHYISATSGTVSATGFSSPTVYVNGKVNGTLTANVWNHIAVTTGTSFEATGINIGKVGSNFLNGYIDEFRLYDFAKSSSQVLSDYNARGSSSTGLVLGASDANNNLSNGLVGYWKQDEATWSGTLNEVIDSSGNGNNGQAQGAAGGKAYPTVGKFGNGGFFDGVDDHVNLVNPSGTIISRTLSVWVKPLSAQPTPYRTGVFGSSYAGIDYANGQGSSSFHAITVFDAGSPNYQEQVASCGGVGVWNHLVLSIDAINGKTNFYCNGALESVEVWDPEAKTPLALTQPTLGGFYGITDEARIYNRVLSLGEIAQLYNYAPGPIAEWNFEEGSGTTSSDSSGNGHTATFNSLTSFGQGKIGKAASFASSGNFSVADTINNVKTFQFWLYYESDFNTMDLFQLDGCGSTSSCIYSSGATINISDGFTNPKVYVDGVQTTTLKPAKKWQFITVTADSMNSGSNIMMGYFSEGAYVGKVDQVRLYDYVRTPAQITQDMNAGRSRIGNPLVYYKFDEGRGTIAHNSGNMGSTEDGVITAALWKNNGKFGKALSFDGDTSVVKAPSFDHEIDRQYTLSTWVNAQGGQNTYIVKETHWSDGFKFWSDPTNFGFRAGDGTNADNLFSGVNLGVSNSSWFHIVIVRNGSTWYLYVNGKLKSTATNTLIGNSNNNGELKVGNREASDWTPEFQGMLDDVKLYNFALTADEVKLDYNHGQSMVLGSFSDTSGLTGGSVASNSASAIYCVPGGTDTCSPPVGEWNFEEGQGTIVRDTSGNGYDGTWNGTGNHWTVGKYGKAGNFNGAGDSVYVSSYAKNTRTVSFWVKTSSVTNYPLAVSSGAWVSISSGDVTTFGFDTPGIYVNGIAGGKVIANQWNHIVVISSSNIIPDGGLAIGFNDDGGYSGAIDNVAFYDYQRTLSQVAWEYNKGKPVAHWKMDECQGSTVYDSSGNKINGTITIGGTGSQTAVGTCSTSSTAWGNGATGKFNASLNLDGTNDYVSVNDNNSLDLTTHFSISGWVKTTSLAANQKILAKENVGAGTTANSYAFGLTTSGQLRLTIIGFADIDSTGSNVVSANQWAHVVVTHTGTNYSFYVNGKLNSSITNANNPTANIATLLFGRRGYTGGTEYFSGQLDDIRIYNYALTASQIKTLQNNDSALRFGPNTGSP